VLVFASIPGDYEHARPHDSVEAGQPRRHPARRVLDTDRAAVAAPARREGVVDEQIDARGRRRCEGLRARPLRPTPPVLAVDGVV